MEDEERVKKSQEKNQGKTESQGYSRSVVGGGPPSFAKAASNIKPISVSTNSSSSKSSAISGGGWQIVGKQSTQTVNSAVKPAVINPQKKSSAQKQDNGNPSVLQWCYSVLGAVQAKGSLNSKF